MPEGDSKVEEAKKINILSKYGFLDFIFLFLIELDKCLQNLVPRRGA